MSKTLIKWPKKRKTKLRRSDLEFTNFLRAEIPGRTDAEKERRLLERLLYGKKEK